VWTGYHGAGGQHRLDHHRVRFGEQRRGQGCEPVVQLSGVLARPGMPCFEQLGIRAGGHVRARQDRAGAPECDQRPGEQIVTGEYRRVVGQCTQESNCGVVDSTGRMLEPGDIG